MTPTDFFGQELKIGDLVAYMNIKYKKMELAPISKIGPEKLTLDTSDKSFQFMGKTCNKQTFRFPHQVIKKLA